jgi:hypothetical protein
MSAPKKAEDIETLIKEAQRGDPKAQAELKKFKEEYADLALQIEEKLDAQEQQAATTEQKQDSQQSTQEEAAKRLVRERVLAPDPNAAEAESLKKIKAMQQNPGLLQAINPTSIPTLGNANLRKEVGKLTVAKKLIANPTNMVMGGAVAAVTKAAVSDPQNDNAENSTAPEPKPSEAAKEMAVHHALKHKRSSVVGKMLELAEGEGFVGSGKQLRTEVEEAATEKKSWLKSPFEGLGKPPELKKD